jgi:hypothetical protein
VFPSVANAIALRRVVLRKGPIPLTRAPPVAEPAATSARPPRNWQWKTRVEEPKPLDASPAAITLTPKLTDEELDSLEKGAGDGEIAGYGRSGGSNGASPQRVKCCGLLTGPRATGSTFCRHHRTRDPDPQRPGAGAAKPTYPHAQRNCASGARSRHRSAHYLSGDSSGRDGLVSLPACQAQCAEPAQGLPADAAPADGRPRLDGVICWSGIRVIASGAADSGRCFRVCRKRPEARSVNAGRQGGTYRTTPEPADVSRFDLWVRR